MNSITYKMGNYHDKLRLAGVAEVAVNSVKKNKNHPGKQHSHTNIKKPKRAEVNFLPNFPIGEADTTLGKMRLQIVNEMMKTDKDLQLIAKLKQSTFALRRKEVVTGNLPLTEILERWPALKMESQVRLNPYENKVVGYRHKDK